MSSSLSLRHLRHLSTTAAATHTTTSQEISISKAISKLKSEYDPDKALQIYNSISKYTTFPGSYRYAQDLTINRLANCSRFSDIESLIESQKTDPRITKEPFFSTLIRSYGLAGMFNQARKIYTQMDEFGTPRSAFSFNALLLACNQSKLFNQVPQLFDEMPQRYGFSPDKISYGVLVKSYCDSGSPELAIETIREMEEKGVEITTVTYTTILNSLYKKGKSDEGEKIWDEMVKKGCSLDVASYNVRIMNIHSEDTEIVKGLIEEMSNAGLKPDTVTYNYLISSYCGSGLMDEAKKVYEGLEGNGCHPNASTFRILIRNLCLNGDFEDGFKMFKDSVKVRRIPDFCTLKPLVEGLVKMSKMKEAEGLITMVKRKFPANSLKDWEKLEDDLGFVSEIISSGTSETKITSE